MSRHSPHLFSLSNELLIEVISKLRPLDIHACQCTCRRLNSVIVNSQLTKYILRTALSGVFDPLKPGMSLPNRLHALERWETSWREMDLSKPIASVDALIHSFTDEPLCSMLSHPVRDLAYRPVTLFSTRTLGPPPPPMSRTGRLLISKSSTSSPLPFPRSSISLSPSRM